MLSALRRMASVEVAMLCVVAMALVLRLYGLDWDRGYSYTPHPDERAILMKVGEISAPGLGELGSLLDADDSPWNPGWFPYGSFPLYLLKGVQLLYSLGPGELTDLRLAARSISALVDVVTVAIVFLLGSRMYGRRVGALGAGFAALAVIHIQLSHFYSVDTLLALFTISSVYFMYRVATRGRLRDSVLAGAFIGLGLATKVSLAPIFGAFVMAHLMYALAAFGSGEEPSRPLRERWDIAVKGLATGVMASVAVLFVVQPYTFLDWRQFYSDVVEQSEMVRRIRDYPYTRQYIDTTPYWYHVRQLALWGLGWPLGVVAWAGLAYASVRGMRWRHGLVYLGVGWAVPLAILLSSVSLVAIVAATGIALASLLATLLLRSGDSRADVLLLSWVVPYFLIVGAFEVKFLRYLVPITPFLLLFGSRMLFDLWEKASAYRPTLRPWLIGGLVLLVGSTGFYALAYMAVYRQPHTAVRASHWINDNVPKGSVILTEHWEEGLPNLNGYVVREMPLYDEDTPEKLRRTAQRLAVADYLVFYSNRLYGTITRLPRRYPISGEYYRQLFSDRLGYELVAFEATYPELLGVGFVEDTFRRPGVPEPEGLRGFRPSRLSLGLGFADESFSVYDHPKVMVLQNVGRYDADSIRHAIESGVNAVTPVENVAPDRVLGSMLSPEDAAAQQRGGTWGDIVSTGGWTARVPVLAWLILVQGIALLTLPIALVVFRPLSDRGYLLGKTLGLLFVGLIVWLLASLHWMTFSRGSISIALVVLALVSGVVVARRRSELAAFIRERWPVLVVAEAVFLVAFFSFLAIRMANPDLWHPYRGGEKPMDFAYLNAVLRSSYMPPYDPWFGGGFINYYYWGQFLVATLIRATGIDPAVAFNLAVPLFFALTAGGAFSIVYNLAEGTRRSLRDRGVRPPEPPMASLSKGHSEPGERRRGLARVPWSPVLAGICGALFVTVLGNLDGAVQVARGFGRALFQNMPFGQFDFWRSTRMMPPDPPGHEITEFPFFTFLFADLHAHMMALPFTLLVLGLALAVLVGPARTVRPRLAIGGGEIARLAVLGLAVGSLAVLNAWDFPMYLVIALAAVFLGEIIGYGGLGFLVLVRAGIKSGFVVLVGYLAFLPFHLSYNTFFDVMECPEMSRFSSFGLCDTTNTTVLWQFLGISGLFLFIVGSFFVYESREWLIGAWRVARHRGAWLIEAVSSDDDAPLGSTHRPSVGMVVALVIVALGLAYAITAVVPPIPAVGSTIPVMAVLLALVLVAGVRWVYGTHRDTPYLVFAALIVGVALALSIGLDVLRVEGDIDRMNSVFKFYLQIWVLLALASSYLLWRFARGRRVSLGMLPWAKKAWLGVLAALIVSAAVYPILGTQDRLRDRFNGRVIPLTLDGTAYAQGAVYRDEKGDIDLAADFEGIRWLRDNVEGSPVVLEGHTETYRWGGRVSVYTGLPSVVGWLWHQEQQRWDSRWAIAERIEDVNRIYRTTTPAEALSLLSKYGVKYVYVGQLERLYYPGPGLEKFDGALADYLEREWHNGQVSIYRVLDGGP